MTVPSGNKIGRPKKADIVARKENRSVGRPKGTAAIINDYRDRMLNSPKSAKVLEAVFNAALQDGHPHQAAAWKLVMERVAPISAFDTSKTANGGAPQISINISSVGTPSVETIQTSNDIEDVDYRDSDTE